MACDLQATHQSGLKLKVKTKIFEINNKLFQPKKFLIGYAGDVNGIPDVLEYLMDESGSTRPPKVRDLQCVILNSEGKIYTFTDPRKWIQLDEPCYAIGTGAPYALGVLHAGKSVKDAIKAASKFDAFTGNGVKVMTI